MKTTLTVLIALVLNIAVQSTVQSTAQASTLQGELAAIQGALDARNEFVTALENRDFTQIAQNGFTRAIEELAQDLRDRSDDQMADELLSTWQQTSLEKALFMFALDDLGDHAPLFSWLDDFLNKMSGKYGTIIYSLPYVQDIVTLNFAIPVVFSPKGKWQSSDFDNRIEYRKHFIPFANIVTYYAAFYGCKYVAVQNGIPQAKQLCGKVAEKLKFVMGRYIAAPVSDWIFKLANRQTSNSSYRVSNSQLQYNSADELRRAIQGQ